MAGDDMTGGKIDTLASPSEKARQSVGALSGRDCPDDDDVLAYLDGRSTESLRAQIERHLDGCGDCWQLVQTLVGDARLSSAEPEPSTFRVTTFSIGSVIADRYRVERFIGKGGMGEVYFAHDSLMNRAVALKTPLCTTTDDPSALRKFFDEARNADRITHPNICRIYALEEHRDPQRAQPPIPFFTMEFIDGETLAQRLKRGPLPLPTVRIIARQLLEGLRAAHAKRVLHLDFKSDNIMLRSDGERIDVVLMDFGLSRQRDVAPRASQYQRGIGTLPYMAIEQIEGQRHLTPAVDVYAFGVVLFEMLTARFPFVETSLGALLLKQTRERPPAPSRHRPHLRPELDAFVTRCLNRSPRRRFDDASAALIAFEALRDWTDPQQKPRRLRFWREATIAFSLVLAGSASDMLPRETITSSSPRATPGARAPSRPSAASTRHLSPIGTAEVEMSLLPIGAVRPTAASSAPLASPARLASPDTAASPAPLAAPVTAASPDTAASPVTPRASVTAARPARATSSTGTAGDRRAPHRSLAPVLETDAPAARKLQALPKAPIPFTQRRAPRVDKAGGSTLDPHPATDGA